MQSVRALYRLYLNSVGNEGVSDDILLLPVYCRLLLVAATDVPKLPYLSILWLIGLMFTHMSFRFLGFHKYEILRTIKFYPMVFMRELFDEKHIVEDNFTLSERRPSRRRCIIKARRYKE